MFNEWNLKDFISSLILFKYYFKILKNEWYNVEEDSLSVSISVITITFLSNRRLIFQPK